MEIKAQLLDPYTEEEKEQFIVDNNHRLGYEIRRVEREIIEPSVEEEVNEETGINEVDIIEVNEEGSTPEPQVVIDLQAWGYTSEELLGHAKENKNNENTIKAKDAVENGYVEFKDAQFETNTQTVGDLTAVKELMQETGMETYTWLSRDDKSVVLTLADFRTLGVLIAQYKNNVWNVKYLDFKQQIALAETLEEVNAIVIDYNVPEIEEAENGLSE